MNVQPLLDAINDRNIVSGLTHDIYRYPARFSPSFAKAAIELFTEAGDTILDPFMGGSTSLVEALALGRHAVGIDINQLAVFLARVKTLLLSDEELESLRAWAEPTIPDLSPRKPVVRHTFYQGARLPDEHALAVPQGRRAGAQQRDGPARRRSASSGQVRRAEDCSVGRGLQKTPPHRH